MVLQRDVVVLMSEMVTQIAVDQINVGDFNPRKVFDQRHIRELAGSIKMDGQWNPIIVKPNSHGYDLIAGECRLRAFEMLGLLKIRARIVYIDDEEAHLLALKTNLMRQDLNPIDEADAIKNLVDKDWTLTKIARELNKSISWASQRLKLASQASEGVKNALMDKKITFSAALEILSLPEGLQGSVASKAIEERLNFNEIKKLVKLIKLAENAQDLDLFLSTPLKEFITLSYKQLDTKIQKSRIHTGITILNCDCGTKIIIDWQKRCVVDEKVINNEH